MTKAELIEKLARSRDLPPEMTKKVIGQVLDLAFSELSVYFEKSRVTRATTPRFTFPGFGTFTKKKRSARKGVHPRTLEPIEIDASYTIDFKPAAGLKRGMNGERSTPRSGSSGETKTKAKAETTGTSKRGKKGRSAVAGAAPGKGKRASGRRPLISREEVELASPVAESPSLTLDDAPLRRVRGGTRGSGQTKGRVG